MFAVREFLLSTDTLIIPLLKYFLIPFRGNVDFYPNRGKAPQPGEWWLSWIWIRRILKALRLGCEVMDVLTLTACSHYRAPAYFSESILVPDSFLAHQCDLSLIQLPTFHNCLNGSTVALMGEHVDRAYVSASFPLHKTSSQFNFPFVQIFVLANLLSF